MTPEKSFAHAKKGSLPLDRQTKRRTSIKTSSFIPVSRVKVNPRNLRRVNRRKVAAYAYCYEAGEALPPIKVEANQGFFTIWDGRHRFLAQLEAGYSVIEVEIVAGIINEEEVCMISQLLKWLKRQGDHIEANSQEFASS